jgi:hypothetical protein
MRALFPVALALGVFVASAGASDNLFIGFDPNPGSGVPDPPFVNTAAARTGFVGTLGRLGALAGVEDFESFTPGPAPGLLNAGSVAVTLTTLGNFGSTIRSTPMFDTFATSGENFLYAETSENTPYWRMTFGSPVRAIGFTHTDASDWTGTPGIPPLQVIIDAGLATHRTYNLLTIDTSLIPSGSVGFFGVIADAPITSLTIYRPPGGGNTDALGLDDLLVGVGGVPTPGTAGLLGVGACCAGARRRRR